MATALGDLPVELIDAILSYLSLQDTHSCRLVSRALQRKATRGCFRDLFRRKHLELSQENLENFIAVTRPGRLGCLIEELTLSGLVIDYKELARIVTRGTRIRKQLSGFITLCYEDNLSPWKMTKARAELESISRLETSSDELIRSRKAVKLLACAFENIRLNAPTQRLRRLSLGVSCVKDDPDVRYSPFKFATQTSIVPIWSKAIETFQIAVSALVESKLVIQDLVLYNDRNLDVCSLAQSQLQTLDFSKLESLASHLTSLSVSLSARERPLMAHDSFRERSVSSSECDLVGLDTLIGQCPALQVLSIHYFSLDHDKDHVHNLAPFPKSPETSNRRSVQLELLTLAGLVVRGQDLLDFLKRNRSKRLELEHVKLTDGLFRPIFDFCCHPDSGLSSLHLNSLHERKLVWFLGPGFRDAEIDSIVNPLSDSRLSLSREGSDILRPINYHFPRAQQFPLHTNILFKRFVMQRFGPFTVAN